MGQLDQHRRALELPHVKFTEFVNAFENVKIKQKIPIVRLIEISWFAPRYLHWNLSALLFLVPI